MFCNDIRLSASEQLKCLLNSSDKANLEAVAEGTPDGKDIDLAKSANVMGYMQSSLYTVRKERQDLPILLCINQLKLRQRNDVYIGISAPFIAGSSADNVSHAVDNEAGDAILENIKGGDG